MRRRRRNGRSLEWSLPLVGSLAMIGFFVTFLVASQVKSGAIVPSS